MPAPATAPNDAQWGEILAIFSLDVTQPFLPAAGWRSAHPERALELLRSRITNARAALAQNPEAKISLAGAFLRSVRDELGEEEANRLTQWAEQIYYQTHADSPQWSGWEIAFGEWLHRPETREKTSLSAEEWTALLKPYAEWMNLDVWREKINQIKQGLLSDWDLLVFARRGYLFDDAVADPFIAVMSWISRYQFQRFWQQTVAPLPFDVKARLRQGADALLKTMEVWMPGPLEFPDRLN